MAPHRKSKRESLKHKYKVQRKVAEHHRRLRKLLRKQRRDGILNGSRRVQRDLGVPNLYPYKQELLEQAARRLALRSTVSARAGSSTVQTLAPHASLASSESPETTASRTVTRSRRAFAAELRRVVELSDVVLEVLDARNPLESRSMALERLVRTAAAGTAGGKRLVLVLSKADLVPHEALRAWICRLRAEYPTIATHDGLDRAGLCGGPRQRGSAAHSIRLAQLAQLLKQYARKGAGKQSNLGTITVGVVGKPNVGKSSLLNALVRNDGVVATGARPGVTRALQEVRLDRHVRLLDSPGVVLDFEGDTEGIQRADGTRGIGAATDAVGRSDEVQQHEARMALAGYIGVEELCNPISAARLVLERSQFNADGALSLLYEMPSFALSDMVEWTEGTPEDSFVMQFLALLAKRRGLVRKAGMLDLDAAAQLLVQDWVTGKIPYYTTPQSIGLPSTQQLDAEIVSSWGTGFDLDLLEPSDKRDEEMTLVDTNAKPAMERMKEADDQVTYHILKHVSRRAPHPTDLTPGVPQAPGHPPDEELSDFEFNTD
ncbi:Guanine nucleotide-binding protein-like 3 [Cyanidiococcus yangmingshanensis]|uniref:Guanine nucleotide-binding protein-like 3 n=1 Tax=Cyanidiococcus yangmingshanensis TaxID=2690220 RepID=A0A7J7IFH6_9RHOD|nr:Guanine nucleotide-binding protein-like 3 [Cyanidiococcus yangmingshanensis]